MSDLKLMALDEEDLAVIAAHLQDSVLRVGDMAYIRAERRFAIVLNRFDWGHAVSTDGTTKRYIRRQTGVRIEHVEAAKVLGIDLSDKDRVLSLLTLMFEPGDAPRGMLTLAFAGGGAVRLEVECLEAALTDLGAAWSTRRKPEHAGE